jgi:hypothetical protein
MEDPDKKEVEKQLPAWAVKLLKEVGDQRENKG